MGSRSKRYIENSEKIDPDQIYSLDEGLALIKESSKLKFDETVDIAINLNIDPTFSDQNVRGVVNLPNGIGKDLRVAVFAKGDKAKEAEEAGADIVGADELVEKVSSGEIDFERCIATPDMMPLVGKLGKVLGPKGLMPNPKIGTVTNDVSGAVKSAKAGSVEYRNDKSGIIHAGVGKVSFSKENLNENVIEFVKAVKKDKPSAAKGVFIKKVSLSSTMGAGLRIDTGVFN
jgi:large subunit ribosomal protein L1